MDISRPCQPDKLIPLLPWPGFDPSFSGHNDRRAIIREWTWLRLSRSAIGAGVLLHVDLISLCIVLKTIWLRKLWLHNYITLHIILSLCRLYVVVTICHAWYQAVWGQPYVPRDMFPGTYVSRVLCSPGPMFPGSYVPRVLCGGRGRGLSI